MSEDRELQIGRARLTDLRDRLAVEWALDHSNLRGVSKLTGDLSPITLQHSSVLSVSVPNLRVCNMQKARVFLIFCAGLCRTFGERVWNISLSVGEQTRFTGPNSQPYKE